MRLHFGRISPHSKTFRRYVPNPDLHAQSRPTPPPNPSPAPDDDDDTTNDPDPEIEKDLKKLIRKLLGPSTHP